MTQTPHFRINKHPIYAAVLCLSVLSLSTAVQAGTSENTRIPAGQALLIGGDTPGSVDVDGQNRSRVKVEVLIERDRKRHVVQILEPREGFLQSLRKDETIVFRNTSTDQRALVYWHISGYSMAANPRVEK